MARTPQAYSTASQAPALQRVWTSMRVMRRFTTGDLITTAEAGETAVQKYVKALHQAGYLRLQTARVSGRPGSRDIWALVRDTGPLAPIRRRDGSGVYDANTQAVWNLQGVLVPGLVPQRQHGLTLAHREALRLLASDGTAKASFDTLRELHRRGFIAFDVRLTELGQAMATHVTPAKTQRAGAQATEGSHA